MGALLALSACASMPDPKFKKFEFPKNAYVGDVQRPYKVLGPVRSKIDYQTLDPAREEKDLCRNYYNRAVKDLVKFAKKQGGDAVIDIKSVVFLVDGRTETYATPECSDDGGSGQILTQGIAVKWTGKRVESGSWSQPPVVSGTAPSKAQPTVSAAVLQESKPTRGDLRNPENASDLRPRPVEGAHMVILDEDGPAAAGSLATAPAIEPGTSAADAPVTAKMEDFDPKKGLVPAASEPPKAAPEQREPATMAAPAPIPMAAPAPASLPAPARSLADPRRILLR